MLALRPLGTPLRQLQRHAEALVPRIGAQMHRQLELSSTAREDIEHLYNVSSWTDSGRLIWRPTQTAHGLTSDITLAFFLRRRYSDTTWDVDCILPNYLYVALSRSTRRLHVFVEYFQDAPWLKERMSHDNG